MTSSPARARIRYPMTRARGPMTLLSSERIVEAMRSARLWRERCRRPNARGRTPKVMDNRKVKSIFLCSLRLAALGCQARRNRMRRRAGATRPMYQRVRVLMLIKEPVDIKWE